MYIIIIACTRIIVLRMPCVSVFHALAIIIIIMQSPVASGFTDLSNKACDLMQFCGILILYYNRRS